MCYAENQSKAETPERVRCMHDVKGGLSLLFLLGSAKHPPLFCDLIGASGSAAAYSQKMRFDVSQFVSFNKVKCRP